MGTSITEGTNIREVTIKGIDENHLVVDIRIHEPYFVKCLETINGEEKIVRRKNSGISENNIVLIDRSNDTLLEKLNLLEQGDIVYFKYHLNKGVDSLNTENWQLLDILDDIDIMELHNECCLIRTEVPKKKFILQPRRKATNSKEKKTFNKDTKIAELEKENAQLKSQVQLLQKQLEEKLNVD